MVILNKTTLELLFEWQDQLAGFFFPQDIIFVKRMANNQTIAIQMSIWETFSQKQMN